MGEEEEKPKSRPQPEPAESSTAPREQRAPVTRETDSYDERIDSIPEGKDYEFSAGKEGTSVFDTDFKDTTKTIWETTIGDVIGKGADGGEDSTEQGADIDLRQAIIHKAILERPYP